MNSGKELDRRTIVGIVALVLALAAASTIAVAALVGGIGPASTCSDPQLPAPAPDP